MAWQYYIRTIFNITWQFIIISIGSRLYHDVPVQSARLKRWPLLLGHFHVHSFTLLIRMGILKRMIMFLPCFRLYCEWIFRRTVHMWWWWWMLIYSIAIRNCSCHMHQIFRNQNTNRTVSSLSLLSIYVHYFYIWDMTLKSNTGNMLSQKKIIFIDRCSHGFVLFLSIVNYNNASAFILDFKCIILFHG